MDDATRTLEYCAEDLDLGAISRGPLDQAREAGYSAEAVAELRLIIEEVVTNVARHSRLNGTPARLEWQVEHDAARLVFIDRGVPFDPLAPSDASLHAADHATGKMGLLLIRSLAQSIEYHRRDGENHLSIVYVPASAAPGSGERP